MKKDYLINGADLYQARYQKPVMDRRGLRAAIALTIGSLLIYAVVFMIFVL